MNKSELIAAMADKTGETKKNAEASLNALIELTRYILLRIFTLCQYLLKIF